MHVKRDFGGESNGMAFSIGNISEMKEIHLRYSFWLFYRNVSNTISQLDCDDFKT